MNYVTKMPKYPKHIHKIRIKMLYDDPYFTDFTLFIFYFLKKVVGSSN